MFAIVADIREKSLNLNLLLNKEVVIVGGARTAIGLMGGMILKAD
ncbi:hypothetical protein [Peribacillus butanolivorans]|nr:hypothetical protein [Peribacillus butanolivorans]